MSFKEIFNTILTADKDKSREATREARKYLYSARGEKSKYDEIKKLILEAPAKYQVITEDWRQENFAIAISVIFFLRDKKSLANSWFSWQFDLLEHKNGNVRQAAVRMLINELGPLTVHLRFPGEKSYQDIPVVEADKMLLEIFVRLRHLLQLTWKPSYKKHKYVTTLPSSPYKSAQLVMGNFVDYCGKDYVKSIEDSVKQNRKEQKGDIVQNNEVTPMAVIIGGFFSWFNNNQEQFEEKFSTAFDLFWGDRPPGLPPILKNDKSKAFFQEWLMLDYSFNGYDDTLPGLRRSFLNEYLNKNKQISIGNRQFALQMASSYPSFYKVLHVKNDEYIEVRDLFFGNDYKVYDKSSSRALKCGQVIYSRHCVDNNGIVINCGGSVTIVSGERFEMLKDLMLGTYELVNQGGLLISLSDFLKWNSYIYFRELMHLLEFDDTLLGNYRL